MVSGGHRQARVAYARIFPDERRDLFTAEIEDLPAFWRTTIDEVVGRGEPFVYRNKGWRLAMVDKSESLIKGQLGYESRDRWKQYRDSRFRDSERPAGESCNFVLDLDRLLVVFHARASDITEATFVGVLADALRSVGGLRWEVSLLSEAEEFDSWVSGLDAVNGMRLNFSPAHIGVAGPEVKRIVNDLGAATLIIREPERQQGLNCAHPLIVQAIDYIERGGGSIRAFGRKTVGEQLVFTTWEGRETARKMARMLPIEGDVDLPFESLINELKQIAL
ncbi:hypothetical protein [Cryptosporangium phraense]|uniref:Uncharacterized protein n=1 Tax=Cryptosporangium phraense TaxID=2593070 RepID=A0A545AGE8_9ACTN|nr:hypothetical protein [Cryptosporangium phraense]TQS40398.1 hypothetical protein FL583_35290 [Cryptosporangium phraense]